MLQKRRWAFVVFRKVKAVGCKPQSILEKRLAAFARFLLD
jgi:hypothetical protein